MANPKTTEDPDTITITAQDTAQAGAPSTYTPEIAAEICAQIMEGHPLKKITQEPGMPALRTILWWLVRGEQKEEFGRLYAHARVIQADTLADDILYTARHEEDVNRARLIVDAQKWVASKLKPHVYGDIRQVDVSGGVELSIAPVAKITHKTAPQIESEDAQDAR